jgi:Zn-dependent peptidase ImmA (M78 family)
VVSGARVAVSTSIWTWALSRAEDAERIKRAFPDLLEWQSGKRQPTIRQLEKFAKATATPFGFFFLQNPPLDEQFLPLPDFRTVSDGRVHKASTNLLETIRVMERRQTWMREYLRKQGHEKLSFVGSADANASPEEVAEQIRFKLRLSSGWAATAPNWTEALSFLRTAIESAGILVFISSIVGNNTHRKLDPKEFRGFVMVDDYAPVVFVNSGDAKAAQMFTLAHELAHVWVGANAVFDLRDLQPAANDIEQACNLIAAEFLLPAASLRATWNSVQNRVDRFDVLARQFKISQIVVARRALDLGLISRNHFFEFLNAYYAEAEQRSNSGQDEGGGDFYKTQNVRIGKRFASIVIRAAKEGGLLYRDAYKLTDLYGTTFDKYATELGV